MKHYITKHGLPLNTSLYSSPTKPKCVTVSVLQAYLHDCVIRRDEDREQIKVPGSENKCQEHLGLPRDA